MLKNILLWGVSLVNPRYRKFQEAQGIYDRYTRQIELKLEGPTEVQCQEARSISSLKRAQQLYFEVLELCRNSGDAFNAAVVHYQLGLLERLWGNYEQASQYFQEALTQFEQLVNQTPAARSAISFSHFYLGHVLIELNECDSANRHLITALEIDQTLGDSRRIEACNALLMRCK